MGLIKYCYDPLKYILINNLLQNVGSKNMTKVLASVIKVFLF